METLKQHLNNLLGNALHSVTDLPQCNANVITSSKREFGDYQANGVMAIAKQLNTNPKELAKDVQKHLENHEDRLVERLEVAGPGFINIFLRNSELLGRANTHLNDLDTLIPKIESSQTIVIDYSSPNLAKEMHVGHLRGTIIGDSLARILERLGHRVVRQNHVGDWGTQFGMLIAYMKELPKKDNAPPDQLIDLENFYKVAKNRFDSDPVFADSARSSVVSLQRKDPEYMAIWEQFIEESMHHCEAVYEKLNVTLKRKDLDAESSYNEDLPVIVEHLTTKKLLKESEGALCVFLPEFVGKNNEPLPVIIQKTDGSYLYATTDLAAIRLRSHELKADRSIYVVDVRQSLHFQQVFAVAKVSGLASSTISLEHISYGTIMDKDGKPFRTRSGGTVKLADLLNESVRRALALVTEKNPKLNASDMQHIAQKVGIAAVKYADLSKNRTSNYIFDWSSMLSFEGNTAPYLMYAYARIKSMLRKQEVVNGAFRITSVSKPEERELLLKNLQLAEVLHTVAVDCYPNHLCNYLYELAGCFMRFYENCPILKAETQERESRLALCMLTAESLQQGLDLLGIETLEQM